MVELGGGSEAPRRARLVERPLQTTAWPRSRSKLQAVASRVAPSRAATEFWVRVRLKVHVVSCASAPAPCNSTQPHAPNTQPLAVQPAWHHSSSRAWGGGGGQCRHQAPKCSDSSAEGDGACRRVLGWTTNEVMQRWSHAPRGAARQRTRAVRRAARRLAA